ncbi:carbonic anhydrase 2-like isoform X2 [Ostrea edulis]|nr:carbonic anhydrase 2-like isoform X2 [Ostrea edulis]XP_056023076.1 carbonic anhydrase 2-like isoform X2 [Ostrea edulis]XP_056023077.1 carbonic anhydrase 2-like isoform X2 [Ostrea edulis]XP_056023078.1 carbonic anhydrase 2-like isoform X2 [Ostrea edulis]XP_056023079.1 carbonic anhydrase 2-like isoform X2 [Ostrea edulis]
MSSWGYHNNNGPSTWSKGFPIANGQRQSPIDISTKGCEVDNHLSAKPFHVNYAVEKNVEVSNTGSSIKVQIREVSELSGGPLESKPWRLEQFHLHWGSTNDKGSEHTIDGKTYAAELHLVHWNAEKYSSFGEAADKPDGLAVIGFMVKVGNEHAGFKPITEVCSKIQECGGVTHLDKDFNPSCMLGSLDHYWTYLGSLTTPPLFESVTWTLCSDVIEISQAQMDALRSLKFKDGDCMVDNFRPPVPLCGRCVRASK